MNLLLDTCSLIWLCAEPNKLSSRAIRAIDGSNILGLSDLVIMEIAIKWNIGKLKLPDPPRYWINEQIRKHSLDLFPMGHEAIFQGSELPLIHKDPFDRILIAQAQLHGLTIVTPDTTIHRYPVSTLW